MKYLIAFDFDDTLYKTDWTKPSDFLKKIKSATPLTKVVDTLKKILSIAEKRTDAKVVILTARPIAYPVAYCLKSQGINITVVATADRKYGGAKADWIEKQIKDGYNNNILFVDDKQYNIDKVTKMASKYDVVLKTILIK